LVSAWVIPLNYRSGLISASNSIPPRQYPPLEAKLFRRLQVRTTREDAMKILIALDGSAASEVSIQEAVCRPWPEHSQFELLTAVDPFFFVRAPLLLAEARKSTEEGLEENAKKLRNAGWETSMSVVMENPRHAISRFAAEWKADLILLGSRGRSTIERLLIGSTAQSVLRHAHCSVEIVRAARIRAAGEPQVMKILIPTDGSECAERAMKSLAARPWPAGSRFKVIACPEFPVLIGSYPYLDPELVTEMMQASEQHSGEAARKFGSALEMRGFSVETEVTEPRESPAHGILTAAENWQADLIVMGSHGRRGFDRMVLGSVSESVAMHAHCSVEVVR
jgi:nucleotide-binding universal stress UspA family protein